MSFEINYSIKSDNWTCENCIHCESLIGCKEEMACNKQSMFVKKMKDGSDGSRTRKSSNS